MKWEVMGDNSMQSGAWRRAGICMEDLKIKTRSLNSLGLELVKVQEKCGMITNYPSGMTDVALCSIFFPLRKKKWESFLIQIEDLGLWDHKYEGLIKLMTRTFFFPSHILSFIFWKISLSTQQEINTKLYTLSSWKYLLNMCDYNHPCLNTLLL